MAQPVLLSEQTQQLSSKFIVSLLDEVNIRSAKLCRFVIGLM